MRLLNDSITHTLKILGIVVNFKTNTKRHSLYCQYCKAIDFVKLLNIFSFITSNEF